MKVLFFLLLFANLAMALYLRSPAVPPPAAGFAPSPAPRVCLEWGPFIEADRASAEAAIARRSLHGTVAAKVMDAATVHWIHIPPLGSRARAEKKMGELDRLGVTGHTHVDDDGKWNHAISMGHFPTLDDAEEALAEYRRQGVRSAIIVSLHVTRTAFVAQDASEEVIRALARLKEDFPGSELKRVACAAT